MNRLLLISLLLPFSFSCSSSQTGEQEEIVVKKDTTVNIPQDTGKDLSSLNTRIRDGKIRKEEALALIKKYLPLIDTYYYGQGGKDHPKSDWIFPLKGYTSANIGGTNGSGYIDDGYSYFDGNKHKGHPAHDIFIHDSNQDCLDDRTKEPVNVLSLTGGIVIAVETNWESASNQRGGNYIWIYDPGMKSLFYYAHNKTVLVKPGMIIKPGDVIATVGRTGSNACKKRSPTHLHVMQLVLGADLIPKPVNPFTDLQKAKVIQ